MGLDERSKGVRIYWPDTRTVGIERNVYVDKTGASASRLEGEEWDGFGETNTDAPCSVIPQNPSNAPTNPENAHKSNDLTPIESAPHDIPSDIDETQSEPDESSDCHGSAKPAGSRVGLTRVRVRVDFPDPQVNPYPQRGLRVTHHWNRDFYFGRF